MASLTQTSLAGIRWSAGSQFLAQLAQYSAFVLLARLLSPNDFGTVASATLVIGLVAMLNELGLGAALIQRPRIHRGHLNACFWANLVAGSVLMGLTALAASWVETFFHNPGLAPLVVALATSFPLVGLAVVPKAMLEKALRFRELGLIDASAAIANGAVSIAMAVAGYGAWSLVVGTLAMYVVQAIGLWWAADWWPGWRFSRQELVELFNFGMSVLGSRVVTYINGNIDYLLIGRLLGPTALGAYSLGYKLVTWPMLKISHVVLRVAFPAFARVQHDDATMRRQYARLIGTLGLIVFPLLAGLAVIAPEVIPLVFGAKWASAVPATQVLCLAGAFKALVCSIGTIFLSKARPDIEFWSNVAACGLLAVLVGVGVHAGIVGVAIAVTLSAVIFAPIQQTLANRLIHMSWAEYASGLLRPALATALMAVLVELWRWAAIAHGLASWQVVVAGVPVGALVYLAALSALGFDWRALWVLVTGRNAASTVAPR